MPPSKARRMVSNAGANKQVKFKAAKRVTCTPRKTPLTPAKNGQLMKDMKEDKDLMKLRIPDRICSILPSVRKYHGRKNFVDLSAGEAVDKEAMDEVKTNGDGSLMGFRKGRGPENKYRIRQISEQKFSGMIWDVLPLPSGDVLISLADRAVICDGNLQEKTQLDNIYMGGGVSLLSDGRLVVVCRNFDTINIFSAEGKLIKTFPGGTSPMLVAVNSKDQIIVTDVGPGDKYIRVFDAEGAKVRTIAQEGKGYQIEWPLYLGVTGNDEIIVGDCHTQEVLKFDELGRFVELISLKTFGGNEVLRPHGLCINEQDDLFVVDNATFTVEVFASAGHYLQTLVRSEEGIIFRPKVLRTSPQGMLVIGGLTGHVEVFKFMTDDEVKKVGKIKVVFPLIKPEAPEPKSEGIDDVIVIE